MRPDGPISVLIVDDSAMVRSLLAHELSQHPDIRVVGGARDPYEARELIIAHRPEVIILDTDMPRMDGPAFLRKLAVHYPVPVIMCSGPDDPDGRKALEAVEIGAVDVVRKPQAGGSPALRLLAGELVEKIRAAAASIVVRPLVPAAPASGPVAFAEAGLDPARCLVVLGASTGGTEAIRAFLSAVPADFPPTAMVQHMPAGFTAAFAGRLDQLSRMSVAEAAEGDILRPGRALLARGDTQMTVVQSGGLLRIRYSGTELVNRHCPSVDVLFDSALRIIGRQIVGVLLTGMGADGAEGLLALRRAGALTFGQDRESCVVYGMPKVALDLGAVQHQGPPGELPRMILKALQAAARERNGRVPADAEHH